MGAYGELVWLIVGDALRIVTDNLIPIPGDVE